MQKLLCSFLFVLPISIFGQFSSATDDLYFSNVAYHLDAGVHGKGFSSSSINLNTGYWGFNSSIVTEFNSSLRFQQAIGNWKIGLQANCMNFVQYQTNTELGLSLAKDFALNRNWSIRPAIGINGLNSQLKYTTGSYYGNYINQTYSINAGLQFRFKDWQLFGGFNSMYSSTDSLKINDSLYLISTRLPHVNIGIEKSFSLDSLRQLKTTLFYENYQGFNYFNASVIFQKQDELFLIGYSTHQFNLGCGLRLAKQHQVMVSINMQRNSMLQKAYRPGFQLNYKWQLKSESQYPRRTITPSF